MFTEFMNKFLAFILSVFLVGLCSYSDAQEQSSNPLEGLDLQSLGLDFLASPSSESTDSPPEEVNSNAPASTENAQKNTSPNSAIDNSIDSTSLQQAPEINKPVQITRPVPATPRDAPKVLLASPEELETEKMKDTVNTNNEKTTSSKVEETSKQNTNTSEITTKKLDKITDKSANINIDKKAQVNNTANIEKKSDEISTKDIFNKLKKDINPVELKMDDSQKSIVIDYPIPQKTLPKTLTDKKLGFESKPTTETDSFNELLRQAYSASRAGMYEASIHYYTKAYEKDKENANTLFALATLYHKLKQFPDAKIFYKKLLKVAPDYKNATNNYLALIAQDSPQKALDEYLLIEKENPKHAGILAQIGMLYLKLDQTDKAENYLKRAIVISPSTLQYRYNLAIVYDKAKNYSAAIHLYEAVVSTTGFDRLGIPKESIYTRIKFLRKALYQASAQTPKE